MKVSLINEALAMAHKNCIHKYKNIKIANKMIVEAVKIYNSECLYWSLELKTPQEVHQKHNQQPYKSYA